MKKIHGVFFGFAVLLIAALVTFTGCGSPGDGSSDDSLTGGASGKAKYAIGDTGPGGGIIFYYSRQGFTVGTAKDGVYNGGTYHYLEAAPADMGTTPKADKGNLFAWRSSGATYDDALLDAKGIGIGVGYANTVAILAVDKAAPAARACKDATYGGKTDWYLPSERELTWMCANRAAIGGFTNDWYWTSTQGAINYYFAFGQHFGDGIQFHTSKVDTHRVRAIRAF
ncbi:hypothetical protein AGMMS49579_02860 [Spirochaetia bacterium]|nr:hypothetical protein AGMMS49579_02860 [Spirochaetia bacterium]